MGISFFLVLLNVIHLLVHGITPIIYVFTLHDEAGCADGLPKYIPIALSQAVVSQPDSTVIFASNFKECPTITSSVDNISGLKLLDVNEFISNRTLVFKQHIATFFKFDESKKTYKRNLWITSALRLFHLEDMMKFRSYPEVIHVEADNLLYWPLELFLSSLRKGYPQLTATPSNSMKSFITASVLWVPSIESLFDFNSFLMEVITPKSDTSVGFLQWARKNFCCKKGGIDPDEHGMGIKPFAVNEMSMIGYYREIKPTSFLLFPVAPNTTYMKNKYITINIPDFAPGGNEVGPLLTAEATATTNDHIDINKLSLMLSTAIWDPSSWGQYLGGTEIEFGANVGFNDPSHIAGQAMRMSQCKPVFACTNKSYVHHQPVNRDRQGNMIQHHALRRDSAKCWMAPFVDCNDGQPPTPILNLHVHSKQLQLFQSVSCPCQDV